jgi:hypothetical protein
MQKREAAAYTLVVSAHSTDVCKGTEEDRNEENVRNDFTEEQWVWISTTELRVLESLPLKDAEQRFRGARNMLGPM